MPVIAWNNQPLTITAKVDAVLNPTDSLLWEHEFALGNILENPNYYNDLPWNGINPGCNWGSQGISSGLWRFTAIVGVSATTPITITDNKTNNVIGVLSAIGETVDTLVPIDIYQYVTLMQNANLSVATVRMQRVWYYDTSGYPPVITSMGNQFSASWNYTPCKGVLTARAKAYDGNNFLVATSNDLTLTITGASSGGS